MRSEAEKAERDLWHDGYHRGRKAAEREAKAAADAGPLAYIILPHDVVRQTLDGAGAACWALQERNILDVLDTLPEAKASARRIALRQDGALSILAVTVAGTMDAGDQEPAVAPTCGVCHGAGYLTTKRGKRRRRPWPRCLACDGAGAQTPAGREVL